MNHNNSDSEFSQIANKYGNIESHDNNNEFSLQLEIEREFAEAMYEARDAADRRHRGY